MTAYRIVLTALLCAILVPISSHAQTPGSPAPPDSVPGRALAAWLSAFNSGSSQIFREFLQAHEPDELRYLDDDMQFRTVTGGLDLRQIESRTPTTIVAILEDRDNNKFARVTMTVKAGLPYKIESFPFVPIKTPSQFEPAHLSESELLAAIKLRMTRPVAGGNFSGAVLVARDDAPIFDEAYGMANRAAKTANATDTRFRIGSMNKMFTAVAIMQLVEAGKVELNAPFGTYLQNYPNKPLASTVTIAELLSHTGGTGDIFGPAFDVHRLQLRALSDYERLYGTRAGEFKPGSRWSYSNYGFILLGLVIESVSGESYYDYVQKYVYAPAGMSSTGSEPEDVAVPNRSVGYTLDEKGVWQPNTDTLPYRGSSAGGGYSTVGDLLRFANALTSHTLLSASFTQMLISPKVKATNGSWYAYGFEDTLDNGNYCYGHSGGAPGQNGALRICPKSGYVVATLANVDPPAAGAISDYITSRLPLNR